jgi:hypothetical protein
MVVGLASVGRQLSLPEWQSCAPATSEARQLAQVVVNYIEAHPERMREDFRRGSHWRLFTTVAMVEVETSRRWPEFQ